MVRTRSQTQTQIQNIESWTLIGTLKEVRIPARPRNSANLYQSQISHSGHTTQILAPPRALTQPIPSPTTSIVASQLSALTEVFNFASLHFRLYAPGCLPILYALRSMLNDFATNFVADYDANKWSPTRPDVETDEHKVRRVLREVHRTAREMAKCGGEDMKDIARAAKWAICLFETSSFNVRWCELERVSVIHWGMWQFVGWMELGCYGL
jgi:hypothetical protein